MATQANSVIAGINQSITESQKTVITEVCDHMTKLFVESNVEVKLIAAQLADIRKLLESAPKAKKAAAAPPAEGAAAPAADVPAAKPKGGKKQNHASWFKATYEADAAFRARIDAIPDIALTLASLQKEIESKKTPKTKMTVCSNAIIAHHGPIVQAEFDAHNVTQLIPANSPK